HRGPLRARRAHQVLGPRCPRRAQAARAVRDARGGDGAMSDKTPPDARAWDRIEQMLDEAELERIASLPTEELHAEMRKAGLEPGKGKALLAAARAKGDAEMAGAPQGEAAK